MQGTDPENGESVSFHFAVIDTSSIGGIEPLLGGIQMFPKPLFRFCNRQPGAEPVFFIGNEFHRSLVHDFTSNTSRKAFPSRLNASTNNIMASPGASASIGLCVMMKL